MKIKSLQITIEPWGLDASMIRVKVSADGIVHSAIIYTDHDDFVSEFDFHFYMDKARREILRMVKKESSDEMQ